MKLKKLLIMTVIIAGLISHIDINTRGGGGGHGGGGRGGGGRGGGGGHYHGGGRGGYGRGGYGHGNWRGRGYGYGGWGYGGWGWGGYPWYGYGWGYPWYGYGYGYPYIGVSYTSSSNADDSSHYKRSRSSDDAGKEYWRILNSTNAPIYVSSEGSARIYIAPGKRGTLYHPKNFGFIVEGSGVKNRFYATSHRINIMQDKNGHFMLGFYGAPADDQESAPRKKRAQ